MARTSWKVSVRWGFSLQYQASQRRCAEDLNQWYQRKLRKLDERSQLSPALVVFEGGKEERQQSVGDLHDPGAQLTRQRYRVLRVSALEHFRFQDGDDDPVVVVVQVEEEVDVARHLGDVEHRQEQNENDDDILQWRWDSEDL